MVVLKTLALKDKATNSKKGSPRSMSSCPLILFMQRSHLWCKPQSSLCMAVPISTRTFIWRQTQPTKWQTIHKILLKRMSPLLLIAQSPKSHNSKFPTLKFQNLRRRSQRSIHTRALSKVKKINRLEIPTPDFWLQNRLDWVAAILQDHHLQLLSSPVQWLMVPSRSNNWTKGVAQAVGTKCKAVK